MSFTKYVNYSIIQCGEVNFSVSYDTSVDFPIATVAVNISIIVLYGIIVIASLLWFHIESKSNDSMFAWLVYCIYNSINKTQYSRSYPLLCLSSFGGFLSTIQVRIIIN